MKYWTFILFIVLSSYTLKSQDKPLYSQYLLNQYLINPAIAGINGCSIFQTTNIMQWTGIKDAPMTNSISYHSGIKNVGLGALVYKDRNGLNSTLGFQVTFAYHILINDDYKNTKRLSFGLSYCGNQYSTDESAFTPIENDPIVTGNIQSAYTSNANAGIYFEYNNLFLGLSVANLLPQTNNLNKSILEPVNSRNYFFHTGYAIELNNAVNFEPSVCFKTKGKLDSQLDLNIKTFYKPDKKSHTFWNGLSYRRSADNQNISLSVMVGYIAERYHVAYAYDLGLTSLQKYNFGTHEITIGFNLCPNNEKDIHCPVYGKTLKRK